MHQPWQVLIEWIYEQKEEHWLPPHDIMTMRGLAWIKPEFLGISAPLP